MPAGQPATCIVHPDRVTVTRVCATALRDGGDPAHNVCGCCDECVAACLATPHSCGGTPVQDYDPITGRCRVCGVDITRWLPLSRWGG